MFLNSENFMRFILCASGEIQRFVSASWSKTNLQLLEEKLSSFWDT